MEFAANDIFAVADYFQRPAFWVHGGGDSHGPGLVAWLDHFLAQIAETGLSGLGGFLLPGLTEIGNVHPILVHFPIALLSCFLLVDVFAALLKNESLRAAATWMLYLGTLGAAATVATGFLAAETVAHGDEVHKVMKTHMGLGFSVLGLALFLSVWRVIVGARFSAVGRGFHLLVGTVMVGLMMFGADLGGLMVYKYGVSVQSVVQPDDHDHVHDQDMRPEVVPEAEPEPTAEPKSKPEHDHGADGHHHHE